MLLKEKRQLGLGTFKKIHKLLFPGYIFVRINMNSKDIASINSTKGISRLIRRGDKKVGILPDDFIKNLRNLSQDNIKTNLNNIESGKKS